ncbi:MAG: NADH-quinone oxidoreductase subunit J [Thermoguttaceae bacterium]|jgi:NADH-quinone oxidoreductase subunit J
MFTPNYILIFATFLAAVGMWLLLPRGGARGRSLGAVLAVIALGLGASQMPYLGDWVSQGVFSILAGVTVVAAAAAVSFRKPIYCAIWFGLTLLGVAGLFLLTGAQFLAVATIVVYAGAILVTFLFVLMLANQEGKTIYDRVSWEGLISAATGMVIVGVLSMTIGSVFAAPNAIDAQQISTPSPDQLVQGVLSPYHVASFGMELFGRHLIAIEVAGTLLLAALVGAAVIVAQNQRVRDSGFRVQDSSPDSCTNSEPYTPNPEP